MKKPVKSKAKAAKRPAKSPAAERREMPDLVAVMMKVAERLEALEKKMELVVAQTSVRPPQARQLQPPQHQNQVFHQNHARQGRVLHRAVCADCRKDCEVPFKPTGERPTYCKECFAKRKAARNSPKTNIEHNFAPMAQRQVRVIPNGGGKVTISEIVSSSTRDRAAKRNPKSARKSK